MRSFVLALCFVPILSACASETVTPAAEPKPVLILSEWNYPLHIGHPWPIEVHLVAYDNGLVIRQPRAERRLADKAKIRLATENASRGALFGGGSKGRRT